MFSLDTAGLISEAASIFAGLGGIVVLIGGLKLGFRLVVKVGEMLGNLI